MADIRAFRGVTYDPQQVELSSVLCPPYDVISPPQQEQYYEREPRNAVRIVLNRTEGEARYREAAAALQQWLREGLLRRDPTPGLYVHRQTFDVPSPDGPVTVTRLGLLAAVRLEPWSAGVVRPHEHTMPGPKQDRLALMRTTRADTEPIWVFHPDPERSLLSALEAIAAEPPHLDVTFHPVPGVKGAEGSERHELWRVQFPATVERLVRAGSAMQLYIADGHHRYETALHHAQEVGGPRRRLALQADAAQCDGGPRPAGAAHPPAAQGARGLGSYRLRELRHGGGNRCSSRQASTSCSAC